MRVFNCGLITFYIIMNISGKGRSPKDFPSPNERQFPDLTFSRLLRPHPRVLGVSVCASTRCFLAGLSSGFPCVAIVATSSLFDREQLFFMSFLCLCPVLLTALTTNTLLSAVVRRAICRWCRVSAIRSRAVFAGSCSTLVGGRLIAHSSFA